MTHFGDFLTPRPVDDVFALSGGEVRNYILSVIFRNIRNKKVAIMADFGICLLGPLYNDRKNIAYGQGKGLLETKTSPMTGVWSLNKGGGGRGFFQEPR